MLIKQPFQHGCRYIANGGALKSMGADYDGVIRVTLENPRYSRRGFWAGAARHYRSWRSANDALSISGLPGLGIEPSAGWALSSIRCQVQS